MAICFHINLISHVSRFFYSLYTSTRERARTQKVLCKNELKITFLLNNFGCFCYKVVSKCNLNKSWWIVVCYLNTPIRKRAVKVWRTVASYTKTRLVRLIFRAKILKLFKFFK